MKQPNPVTEESRILVRRACLEHRGQQCHADSISVSSALEIAMEKNINKILAILGISLMVIGFLLM